MEWLSLLSQIFEVCIIPLLGVATVALINFIQKKTAEAKAKSKNDTLDKYIGMLGDTITDCVAATNQTYVDSLKQQGAFDLEAQKVAFQTTYDAVMQVLSQEAIDYLTEAYGDVKALITNQIEAKVNAAKK